jgi:hypothetical protein
MQTVLDSKQHFLRRCKHTSSPGYRWEKGRLIDLPILIRSSDYGISADTIVDLKIRFFIGRLYRTVSNQLYRFIGIKIVLFKLIGLFDFPPKNLCVGVTVIDTFSSIAAHLWSLAMDLGRVYILSPTREYFPITCCENATPPTGPT